MNVETRKLESAIATLCEQFEKEHNVVIERIDINEYQTGTIATGPEHKRSVVVAHSRPPGKGWVRL